MLPTVTSLQCTFHKHDYHQPMMAAFLLIAHSVDRDVLLAATDEQWAIEAVRDRLAEIDMDRVALLVPVTKRQLLEVNEAIAQVMRVPASDAHESIAALDVVLGAVIGEDYCVKAYYPPITLSEEPTVQQIARKQIVIDIDAELDRVPKVRMALLRHGGADSGRS